MKTERTITLTDAKDACSCNVCRAQNYDSERPIGRRVKRLVEVQIGQNVLVLCPECEMLLGSLISDDLFGRC